MKKKNPHVENVIELTKVWCYRKWWAKVTSLTGKYVLYQWLCMFFPSSVSCLKSLLTWCLHVLVESSDIQDISVDCQTAQFTFQGATRLTVSCLCLLDLQTAQLINWMLYWSRFLNHDGVMIGFRTDPSPAVAYVSWPTPKCLCMSCQNFSTLVTRTTCSFRAPFK